MTLKEAVEEARRRGCGIKRKNHVYWMPLDMSQPIDSAIATDWEVEPVKEEKKRWIAWMPIDYRPGVNVTEWTPKFTRGEKPAGHDDYVRAPWLDEKGVE